MEEAEADALAYLDFPLSTTKGFAQTTHKREQIESLKDVAVWCRLFPSRNAIIRVMGAIYSEMGEDWQSECMFAEEVILKVIHGNPCKPPTSAYVGNTEDQARHILKLLLADNPFDSKFA